MKQYAQLPNMEYCSGDDYGCFELSRGCEQEPHMRFEPLAAHWQLASVRIQRPESSRTRFSAVRAVRRAS
jgi:hypothetical protein